MQSFINIVLELNNLELKPLQANKSFYGKLNLLRSQDVAPCEEGVECGGYWAREVLEYWQRMGRHPVVSPALHAEKSFRNLIKSTRNQIVYTIFRLI